MTKLLEALERIKTNATKLQGITGAESEAEGWASAIIHDVRRQLEALAMANVDPGFDECVASGQSCQYGPHGRHGEMQCKFCGKAQEGLAALHREGEPDQGIQYPSGLPQPVYALQASSVVPAEPVAQDLAVGPDWTPTAENVNALPQPVRDYIHALTANCDPAGMVADNTIKADLIRELQASNRRIRDEFDTPGNRWPEARYAGYTGQPYDNGYTADQAAAFEEGRNARVGGSVLPDSEEPKIAPVLVRDIAEALGKSVQQVCSALASLEYPPRSTNMAVSGEEVASLARFWVRDGEERKPLSFEAEWHYYNKEFGAFQMPLIRPPMLNMEDGQVFKLSIGPKE